MMHGPEKSDPAIVAGKPTNKAERSAAELVERRVGTKGNESQQEVAGATAVPIFDGQPKPTDTGLIILAPAHVASREHYPWLYSSEPTLLVFRVLLFKAGQQDKLLQPVVIGTEVKRQLKEGGYLP